MCTTGQALLQGQLIPIPHPTLVETLHCTLQRACPSQYPAFVPCISATGLYTTPPEHLLALNLKPPTTSYYLLSSPTPSYPLFAYVLKFGLHLADSTGRHVVCPLYPPLSTPATCWRRSLTGMTVFYHRPPDTHPKLPTIWPSKMDRQHL